MAELNEHVAYLSQEIGPGRRVLRKNSVRLFT